MSIKIRVPASFRDPSGFVYTDNAQIYRQVNATYQEHYTWLMRSGLYHSLAQDNLLIPHTEMGTQFAMTKDAFQVIRPEPIPFISYPYEWCFSQLKDAALLTLQIQQRALEHDMSLKDSSAYNVQFRNGKPIFIDTLSFEKYHEGQPWLGYLQFCQHFLAPLALMSHVDTRLHHLLRVYLDGISLDLASSLLPLQTRLNPALLSHLHLHALAQKQVTPQSVFAKRLSMGRIAFQGLVDNLKSAIQALKWNPSGTEWHSYAAVCNYNSKAKSAKKRMVAEMLQRIKPFPKCVWDFGSNDGSFSQIASEQGMLTIGFDKDQGAVEKSYLGIVETDHGNFLPLVMDLANPSPSVGWENQERMSLFERGPADVVLALALMHHLVISNNLSFGKLADLFKNACRFLIIEFVPKQDLQVQKLLSSRQDIFGEYDQSRFEHDFGISFAIREQREIPETGRTLYLMEKTCA